VERILVGPIDRVTELRARGDVEEAQRLVEAEHHQSTGSVIDAVDDVDSGRWHVPGTQIVACPA
jgi:hypothetical protein